MKTTHKIVSTDGYIAEAQRLAIAQNKGLKFIYQTWWALWLPRVAMIAFIFFCVVNHFDWSLTAIFVGFLVLSFLGEWLGRRGLAKARKTIRFKGSTTTVSMDENGVDVVGPVSNSHSKWAGLLKAVVHPNGVSIQVSRISWIWLPDQALVEGSPEDVRKLLAENVRERPSE
jgi:membrane protein implicated in regulation of membrane protease activity